MRNYLSLMFVILILTSGLPAQPAKADQIRSESGSNRGVPNKRNLSPYKPKHNKTQKLRLSPNIEDESQYANFLKDKKTGIFRLMNDADCEANLYVIRVDGECSEFIEGSSNYSFREKEYTTAYLSDIRYKDGLLITDGIFSQNILVRLGDVPIEDLSLESEGMKFLVDFVPETLNTEATRQYVEIVRGVRFNRYEYRKVYPALVNNTYAMRIIAYRGSLYRRFRGWVYDLLAGDDRLDLIVALRVIRRDKDGTISIVWKELARKKSPKIKYDRKKKTDKRIKKAESESRSLNRSVAGHISN